MEPLSKAKLKELASFKQQKNCEQNALFVAEGEKLADEIIGMGVPVHTLCATADWSGPAQYSSRSYLVTAEQLERLSSLRQPNKVWMLIERAAVKGHQEKLSGNRDITLVLDRLQDPGNLGTIIRTADWFGVRHIVCSHDTVSCFNPKVVQSTMGSLFRVAVDYCDLRQWLSSCGKPIYGAVLDGDDIRKSEITPSAAIVIGNESRGISPELQPLLTNRLLIPNIGGSCESLNAAVATGIILSRFTL
ncbi:MAG: RNA methyltransferase [Bacteroidales bacterium]|nr:RNA methyltransferase [Bacteroidales bacterium]